MIDIPKIIAAPMTAVSTSRLAIACDMAGIFPSIYLSNSEEHFQASVKELDIFCSKVGHNNVIVSIGNTHDITLKILERYKIPVIYPLNSWKECDWNLLDKDKNFKRKYKIFKTTKSAGEGLYSDEDVIEYVSRIDAKPVACFGGVYDKTDVDHYISLGATVVGVGTILACSVESPIHDEVKLRMIESSSKDLKRFTNDGKQGLFITNTEDTNYNHTTSLRRGIKNLDGHVYSGTAIDRITKLETVEEIAQRLFGPVV